MNTWNSAGAGARNEGRTGLSWFSLLSATRDVLAAQQDRLQASGVATRPLSGGFESPDPWGTRIRLLRG